MLIFLLTLLFVIILNKFFNFKGQVIKIIVKTRYISKIRSQDQKKKKSQVFFLFLEKYISSIELKKYFFRFKIFNSAKMVKRVLVVINSLDL